MEILRAKIDKEIYGHEGEFFAIRESASTLRYFADNGAWFCNKEDIDNHVEIIDSKKISAVELVAIFFGEKSEAIKERQREALKSVFGNDLKNVKLEMTF